MNRLNEFEGLDNKTLVHLLKVSFVEDNELVDFYVDSKDLDRRLIRSSRKMLEAEVLARMEDKQNPRHLAEAFYHYLLEDQATRDEQPFYHYLSEYQVTEEEQQ